MAAITNRLNLLFNSIMEPKASFWQKMGLESWFLKKTDPEKKEFLTLSSQQIYDFLLEKFQQSIRELSFANRIVFYHEYIICLNADDYKEFMDSKKGIFGLIVQECVKQFYSILKMHRSQSKIVEPSSTKWIFRFVSHPEYARGDKGFIGKLLPDSSLQKEQNLRITYIPRQTGIAQTFDINPEILKGFHFYSEGYYEIPYHESLDDDVVNYKKTPSASLARLETILPDKAYAGKKIEYLMNDEEITVSGSEETNEGRAVFRIPSEWVNTPHLRIRYNRKENKFYVASFGEKTILNEKEVARSNTQNPMWSELPLNSRIMLNGIVGINVFKP